MDVTSCDAEHTSWFLFETIIIGLPFTTSLATFCTSHPMASVMVTVYSYSPGANGITVTIESGSRAGAVTAMSAGSPAIDASPDVTAHTYV